MTTAEMNIAVQELKDAQQEIETWEAEWTKATKAGKPTTDIDEIIDQRIARRNGMLALLHALKVEIDRKDYRTIGSHGEMEMHTVWYLS